jgi:hypothetical protein
MKDSEQGFFGFLAGTAFSASRSISNSMYAASERRSAVARADAVAFTDWEAAVLPLIRPQTIDYVL